MITIDELLKAVSEFQERCRRASLNKTWSEFGPARADLQTFCERNQLPIEFPVEVGALIERTKPIPGNWRVNGKKVRETGRSSHGIRTADDNPMEDGSFLAYCWEAGRKQDIRSVDKLMLDWLAT